MAIEATIRRGYAARLIIIAVVCGVLGLWGVYDYAVAIPGKQKRFERAELLRECRDALEQEHTAGAATPASDAVMAEVGRILQAEFARQQEGKAPISTPEQLQAAFKDLGAAIETSGEAEWLGLLMTILKGLSAEHHPPLQNYPEAHAAFDAAQRSIDLIGTVTAPSQLDRVTQWAFILCLPCVPFMLWSFVVTRRQVYRLDDDGTLQAPEGTWQASEIADIDMSRWMAKSIAWVVHRDGARLKLDDYKFRDLHKVVGAIAARLHPDQWDADAKPVPREGEGEPVAAAAGGGEPDGNGQPGG